MVIIYTVDTAIKKVVLSCFMKLVLNCPNEALK